MNPRLLRYSPVNGLVVEWGSRGASFNECGLPQPAIDHVCKSSPSCFTVPKMLISEAIDSYSWERWLPEVIVGIENPHEEMAASYVREAAIEFTNGSRALQRRVVIKLQKGIYTYPVVPFVGERVKGVLAYSFAGDCWNPCGAAERTYDTISINLDTPRQEVNLIQTDRWGQCCLGAGKDKYLQLLVWATISEDACEHDKFLYDNFRRPISQFARTNYVLSNHFRDRELLSTMSPESVFRMAVKKAKLEATRWFAKKPRKPGSYFGGQRW